MYFLPTNNSRVSLAWNQEAYIHGWEMINPTIIDLILCNSLYLWELQEFWAPFQWSPIGCIVSTFIWCRQTFAHSLTALKKPLAPQNSYEYSQWPAGNADMLFHTSQKLGGACACFFFPGTFLAHYATFPKFLILCSTQWWFSQWTYRDVKKYLWLSMHTI